jgi:hypothetical protein
MKKSMLSGLAALGSIILWAVRKRQYPVRPPAVSKSAELIRIEHAAHRGMMSVIVPVWVAAGLLDYLEHRRTNIEKTSGPRESALHLMMLAEGAPLALAPLMLEVNAGVLALMYAALFAHQGTAMWDVDSTVAERLIPPGEQHVHAFLEGVPFSIAVLYTVVAWPQFLALLGLGNEQPRFEIRRKQPKAPLRDALLMTAAVTVLDVLPHIEEFWRCWKAKRQNLVGTETPECARMLFSSEWDSLSAAPVRGTHSVG